MPSVRVSSTGIARKYSCTVWMIGCGRRRSSLPFVFLSRSKKHITTTTTTTTSSVCVCVWCVCVRACVRACVRTCVRIWSLTTLVYVLKLLYVNSCVDDGRMDRNLFILSIVCVYIFVCRFLYSALCPRFC